jgi:tRNA G18 (ribose-2'-O)-methylase SpoU
MGGRVVRIDTPDDPRLLPYFAVKERDLVGREGLFIAEGEVVVRVLASRSHHRVVSLLLEERRVTPMHDVLEALSDVPVYVVPQAVMDTVVGFPIHRGVLALGAACSSTSAASLVAHGRLWVGLVGLANHDNVGSIFRNAAAFGVDGVLLDDTTCDPLYRKAIRVSAGAALVVPFARAGSPHQMLDLLEARQIEAIALTPRGDETFDALSPSPRVLLLGAEGPGLPEDVMARARRVRIEMEPLLDSLNVAVASGIALHEATRIARKP